jgi:hypothetical protein
VASVVKLRIGELMLSPTESEQSFALLGVGAFLLGWLGGSKVVMAAGALAIAGVGVAVYEEAQTFTDPELMNGFFRTGGAFSATRGPDEAAELRRRSSR